MQPAAALLLTLWIGACLPPQAHYDFGLGTSRITGFVEVAGGDAEPGGPLIIAYKYHHQFVTQGDGTAVLRPTAHVVRPSQDGAFSIDVPADVVTMDVMFIAPQHLTDLFHFRRQVGVGNIRYRARLAPMPDWRSHYYTFLSPQLEHLIVEPRYRLDPAGQRMLSGWLQAQNEHLDAEQRRARQGRGENTPREPGAGGASPEGS